jgi:hypothetical protein
MRRDALARALSSLCTVVTVLGSGRVHTWCDVVVTRGSGSDVDRRRDRRVVSCARGPVNGPCHECGACGTRDAGRSERSFDEIDAEHDVMCVPCGGGAGRGPWGGAFSAQSLQRSTPGDGGYAASQNPRPARLANPQPRRPRAVPHRDARAGAGPRAPDGVAVRAGPRPARIARAGVSSPVPRSPSRTAARNREPGCGNVCPF